MGFKRFFFTATALVLITSQFPIYAQEPYVLKDVMEGEAIGLHFSGLEDESQTMTLEEILKAEKEGKFTPSNEKIPTYGLNPSAQWVKFQLLNPTNKSIRLYLENAISYVDEFELYWQKNGEWMSKSAGDQISFDNRDVDTRQVVFSFDLEPGTHTFYARSIALGTMQLPIHVWTPDNFHASNLLEHVFIGILIGIHVVVCLYNLFLYLSLGDKTYLSYVCYVFANIIFQTAGLGLLGQAFFLSGVSDTISNKIYLSAVDFIAITSYLFSSQFFDLKNRLPWMHKVFKYMILLSIFNLSMSLLISPEFGTVFCFVTASLCTNLLILNSIIMIRKGYAPAKYYLAAWGCYLLGVTFTVANFVGITPTSILSEWGQFTGGAFEVAILSLALGSRINEQKRQRLMQIKELNQTLELKVEERTAEVKSLLKHIPQGILSIGNSGLVEPNYSSQLPTILETNDIAKQSIRELLIDCCDLTEDAKDQMQQVISVSINQHYLNFEANQEKLPHQVTYKRANKEKILRLTWNVEVDQSDEVRHILVTLLDVTEEVAAQKELKKKNDKFRIIEELVEVPSKKSLQFFKSCDQLLSENQRLANEGDINLDSLKILFVNTHTVKGAARSLGLKELANEMHIIESYYAKALSGEVQIDSARISIEMKNVMSHYQIHKEINSQTLGRIDDDKKIIIDKDFLHDSLGLLNHLVSSDHIPDDLRDVIHDNLNQLVEKIYSSLEKTLEASLESSSKIARDLGKNQPIVDLDIDEIMISVEQEEVVNNIMTHLIRNALDHGIEGNDERSKKAKDPRGRLQVRARDLTDGFEIYFSDDGRGFNLQRLQKRAETLGLKPEDQRPESVVALIFETGFSTAEKVSLISGRGVGMAAVKQYIEQVGGTIRVDLKTQSLNDDGYQAAEFVLSFPRMQNKIITKELSA